MKAALTIALIISIMGLAFMIIALSFAILTPHIAETISQMVWMTDVAMALLTISIFCTLIAQTILAVCNIIENRR